MDHINPDFAWYSAISESRKLQPRCPFASVHRCPRYYQSLSLLGQSGFTGIDPGLDAELLESWRKSDLWPVTLEHTTSVSGWEGEGRARHYSKFCPEVAYDSFGFFASGLHDYPDEIDRDNAHRAVGREGADRSDWRWRWAALTPMHYAECPLYSALTHSNPRKARVGEGESARRAIELATEQDEVEADGAWDLFICHASEDKQRFVRPLAEALQAKGAKVWYDEFTLKVGDSLRRSIDKGLRRSRYGAVVLSPAFFQKQWPQYELDGLAQRETNGRKVILPIWHEVTEPTVRQYSPSLAGRVAALSAEGMDSVVTKLLDAMGVQPQPRAVAAPVFKEPITMQVRQAVFSRDENGFILVVEFRSMAPESEQLTKWLLEFPDLRVAIQGGPGAANLLPGARWFGAPPFDIPARKITSGAVFFSGFPNFRGRLPAAPATATLTAHLFPATDPLRQSVVVDYIKTPLRNHQKLIFNGTATWPPMWKEKGSGRYLQGELGILTNVNKIPPQYEVPDHLVLQSRFDDSVWESQLRADDHEFLASLYEKLRSDCIGQSLSEIGSLQVP
jgi:hypothetical protein